GGQSPGQPARLPPEERFWKRYSPHHEFPLSLSSSFFLHVVILVVLLFGGGFLLWLGLRRVRPGLPVGALVGPGGSGGNPQGIGTNRGDGIIPSGPEAVDKDPVKEILTNPKSEQLKDPDATRSQIGDLLDQASGKRLIEEEAPLTDQRLDEILKKLSEKKTQGIVAGRGDGGTGTGGGRGKGEGTGTGGGKGPGQGRPLTDRARA